MGGRATGVSKSIIVLSFFFLLPVLGVRTPLQSAEVPRVQVTAEQFIQSCGACHPDGGNAFRPELPLRKAPQLADFNAFLAYIRSPKTRNGSPTMMPAFPAENLSDQQVKELYHYIIQVLTKD